MWLFKKLWKKYVSRTPKYHVIERTAFIREEGEPDPNKLSLLDIKAAIAAQNIPVNELYARQDLAANRDVIDLVHTAETKARSILEKEIVILKKTTNDLQTFKDKADVVSLVEKCKVMAAQDAATVEYIRARMKSGRGVHFDSGMTEAERQEKVNEAITEELELIKSQGITFKKQATNDDPNLDDFTEDPLNQDGVDMSSPEHNPLIPSTTK